MYNNEEQNQLRISALSNNQDKKIDLFPNLKKIISYLNYKNKSSINNLRSLYISCDSNSNIKCSLIIILAQVIRKSVYGISADESEQKQSEQNINFCLIKFINIFFRHNIRLNELSGIPQQLLIIFLEKAQKIKDLTNNKCINLGEIFGYFRQYEDIYLPIQNTNLTNQIQNFLMKKQLLAQLINFIHYFNLQSKFSISDFIVYQVTNYLNKNPNFTLLLTIAIRSVLFFQYQLYDAWEFQQQVADHTVFTAICDIFECVNLKVEDQNICCFYGIWTIWSTQIYPHKMHKFQKNANQSESQAQQIKDITRMRKKLSSQKTEQTIRKYFITENLSELNRNQNDLNTSSQNNNAQISTNRNNQSSAITFKQKFIQSSNQSNNKTIFPQEKQMQSENLSSFNNKDNAPYMNSSLRKINKAISIEINMQQLHQAKQTEILQNKLDKKYQQQNAPTFNIKIKQPQKESNIQDYGYSSNQIIQFLSEPIRDTMISKRSKQKNKYS